MVYSTRDEFFKNTDLRRDFEMERMVGTVVRGLRAPIIREGDNIADIVVNSVLAASEAEGLVLKIKIS